MNSSGIELRGFNTSHYGSTESDDFRFGSALRMSDTPCRYTVLSKGRNSFTLQNCRLPLTTLRELTMMRLMNQLTDKPNWHKKVIDMS